MHGGAAGQPITPFADGCQVCCIRRAAHSDIWQRAGLIDQPSAENYFLSENVEMIPSSQNALFQHSRRALFQASVWTTAHDSAMIEPDPCLHG